MFAVRFWLTLDSIWPTRPARGVEGGQRREGRRILTVIVLFAGLWSLPVDAASLLYHIDYHVKFLPDSRSASVQIKLGKNAGYVHWVRMSIDPDYYSDFKGSGSIERGKDQILWKPDPKGGGLSFNVRIDHRRKSGSYDALFTEDWVLFRGDDLVPPVHVGMEKGSRARARLHFELPKGWSVAVPYPRYTSGAYKIDHPHRRFDRPTGWMVAGKIGVKREIIEGVKVAVAGPKGQGVRRMDILAHLSWNLPTLVDIFPDFPERLLVVSAGNPMWRGALSGPDSLFLHADRPLISENGTSTLIHELVHVAMSVRAEPGADWLVEGLAEYYSLEVMRRSGTITPRRYERAHRHLEKWGKQASRLDAKRSHGPITAKAVGVLREVDEEIRKKTDNRASLDDVVRALAKGREPATLARVQTIAGKIVGQPVKALATRTLVPAHE